MIIKLKIKILEIFRSIISLRLVWKFFKPIAEIAAEVYQKENNKKVIAEYEAFKNKYLYLLSTGVRRGPFKGLKYPFLSAIYSAFFPKVLGYYEMELHSFFKLLRGRNYSTIHDIGCAEGYYAVGLAKMFPLSKIIGYDLDPNARQKTKEMALENNVSLNERFEIREICTAQHLLGLDPSKKHLIFSDCEGFESELFTNEVIDHLILSDFIIEVHDFVKPGLCDQLVAGFSATHQVEIIKSIDDLHRYRFIEDPELLKLNLADQIRLLEEKRPTQMEWLTCTSLTLES